MPPRDLEADLDVVVEGGFEHVGVEREVGRKFGSWLDVAVMQRLLQPFPETPG